MYFQTQALNSQFLGLMLSLFLTLCSAIKKVYPLNDKLVNWTDHDSNNFQITGIANMEAQMYYNFAAEALMKSIPWMFGRTGMTEANIMKLNASDISWLLQFRALTHSNIFPNTKSFMKDEWAPAYKAYAKDMDVQVHWTGGHQLAHKKAIILSHLTSIEPWHWDKPWTMHLRGKRVLVVTSFPETVSSQYHHKRELLFDKNPDVLPEFEKLLVVGAPMPQFNKTRYRENYKPKHTTLQEHSPSFIGEYRFSDPDGSWFLELESLKDRINKTVEKNGGFDALLIGCGSLAIPIAQFCSKVLGKPSFIFGGAMQVLFGIKGRRWHHRPQYRDFFWNEHWVYPPPLPGSKFMEKGTYFEPEKRVQNTESAKEI